MPATKHIINPRTSVLSWLSYIIGGWNASPPYSPGRLVFEPEWKANDETIVRHFLTTHKQDVERPLKEEITQLKAKLYDLENPKNECLKKPNGPTPKKRSTTRSSSKTRS